jgi:outer membrane protein
MMPTADADILLDDAFESENQPRNRMDRKKSLQEHGISSPLRKSTSVAANKTMNLTEVYQRASDHNAQWQAQQAKSFADRQAQELALSQLLPQITADIQYGQSRYDGNSIDLSPDDAQIDGCLTELGNRSVNNLSFSALTDTLGCLFTSNNGNSTFTSTSYNLRFSQALIRLPKWYEYQSGRMLRRKALLDLEIARQSLQLQSATLYLNSAKTTQLLQQQQQQLNTMQQVFNAKQQAYENGLISSGDVIENQAQLDLMKTTVLQAQLEAENAQNDLQDFIQEPNANISAYINQLPLETPQSDDLNDWLRKGQQNNLELKSARAAVEASRFSYLAQKMLHAPTLDFIGQYSQVDSGAATAVLDEGKTTNSSMGLSLSVPLFTGGYLSANRAQAKFQNKEATWSAAHLQQSIQTQIRKQSRTINVLILQIQQQRDALASNEKALSAITQGYRNGVRHSADVFKAQMDVLSLKRNHTEMQYNYLLATLQLKQLIGILSARDLATLDAWLK